MKKTGLLLILLAILGPLQAQNKTLFEGEWDNDSFLITFEGSWKIVQNGDDMRIVFSEDFEAKKAPDLKIFLSKLDYDDVSAKNAASKSTSLFVAKLTGYKGKASYEIPANINLADYKSIIVHCEQYSKLWGGSQLQ